MLFYTTEFYFPETIDIIPDVLVSIRITKLSIPCLDVMACQTMPAGMKVSITGTQNSHVLQATGFELFSLPCQFSSAPMPCLNKR